MRRFHSLSSLLSSRLPLLLPLLLVSSVPAEDFRFEAVTVDPAIGNVCYAVTAADVNGDGKLDLVAVSENRVQWYENPTWKKHVIIEDQLERDHVCIAPADIDGDGQIDFAIGAGWTKIGNIHWISRTADPGAKWKTHFIGQEQWLHRMSFADVLGTGKPQLVISPLNKTVAEGVRLTAFEIPANPATQRWPATVLNEDLNRMHNHLHLDWDGDGQLDTVVASEQGVYLIRKTADHFEKVLLGTGIAGAEPADRGAGEIRSGRLKTGNFLVTVEPMHGTTVAVYLSRKDGSLPLERVVVAEGFQQGHAIATADFDGDGVDEILFGHREPTTGEWPGPGLYIFRAEDEAGRSWKQHVLDHRGIAVEDAIVADFNNDGRPDVLAGGRKTKNVKLYLNRGK